MIVTTTATATLSVTLTAAATVIVTAEATVTDFCSGYDFNRDSNCNCDTTCLSSLGSMISDRNHPCLLKEPWQEQPLSLFLAFSLTI